MTTKQIQESVSDSFDDLAQLPELEEKTLLQEIHTRYKKDVIYTYIGDILIAVNPYKRLSIYGPENQKSYNDVKLRHQLPPHLYVISDSAYRRMKQNHVNQCCVISGESGAGKTESTKLLIEHIVQLCDHSSSKLDRRIVQVNPLLEAFGNAQTVINDNSSRFGKFIELNFDPQGQILGANISEYLLEKSRVVTHAEGERCFHIFYYLFAGLDKESKEANLLKNPEDHRILKQFPDEKVYDDKTTIESCKEKWNELMIILTTVGFLELDINGILAVLAAILHIADIKFIPDPDSDGVLIENENVLSIISQLLLIKVEELVKAFISNTSSVGIEKITSLKNESQANDGRDALAKALYERLFSWIVSRANLLLHPKSKEMSALTLGILDIYGFENFKNNSFEQLCINVANEQLQSFFNLHIFKLEMEEYKREGVEGDSFTFVDNRPLLDMFTDKVGLFALLDEESRFPQGTDQSLLEKLTRNLKKNQEFKPKAGPGINFIIQHFAGMVTYNVTGFLEKNRDTLSNSIMKCLKTSTSLLVTELFNLHQEPSKTGTAPRKLRMSILLNGPVKVEQINSAQLKKSMNPNNTIKGSLNATDGMPQITKTLASHFKNSLDELVQKLLAAEPHFVRCIKPNAVKEANNFDSALVLLQLNYTGVMETVKIRRQGYSSRIPFLDFISRYGMTSSVLSLKPNDNPVKICQHILEKSGLKEWQLGKTKVFLKYWHIEKLNQLLIDARKMIVKCQQFWRLALARTELKKLRQAASVYADQWQGFSKSVTEISDTVEQTQLRLHSIDNSNASTKEVKDIEPVEKRKLEQPILRKEILSWTACRPLGFGTVRPGTMNATIQFLFEETLDKVTGLSIDIWAKLYYMEKNFICGKIYVREWEVVLNDSNSDLNETVIGIKSPGFDHLDDIQSNQIAKTIGQGVKISRDERGNIFLTKLTSVDVIIKGHDNPGKTCFNPGELGNEGKLSAKRVKVFDMSVFEQRIAKELKKPDWDPFILAKMAVLCFSFKQDSSQEGETPSWVCVINFAALDILGKPEVLEELKRRGEIPSIDDALRRKWASLNFHRQEGGYGEYDADQ